MNGRARRNLFRAALALLLAFAVLQGMALRQARAMLTYREGGARTAPPEDLSVWGKLRLLWTGISLPKPANFATWSGGATNISSGRGADLELWWREAAAPRGTVLLLHGYGDVKSSLVPEAESLARRGWSVALLDFEGHGGSDGHTTTLGWREAEDVCAAVAWLGETRRLARPLVLFGMSMGGAAALRAQADLGVGADGLIVASVFDRLDHAVRNRFDAMGWPAWPAAPCMVFWGGWLNGFNGFRHNPADYAARARVPVLVLHGSDDPRARVDEGHALARAAGMRGTFVPFPGAGHESLCARDPARWDAAVGKWLDALDRSGGAVSTGAPPGRGTARP